MQLKLARIYVDVLLVAILLVFLFTLGVHISILAGSDFQPNGRMYSLWFAVCFPALALAEDRNIWCHEVQQCPALLRGTLYALAAYTGITLLLCIFLGHGMHSPVNFFLAATSFMLTFTIACLCVTFVALQLGRAEPRELGLRVKNSWISSAVVAAFIIVRIWVLPHPRP